MSPLSKVPFQTLQMCLGVLSATLFSLLQLTCPWKDGLLTAWSLRAVQPCADTQHNGTCESRARVGRWMAGEDAMGGGRLHCDGVGGEGYECNPAHQAVHLCP